MNKYEWKWNEEHTSLHYTAAERGVTGGRDSEWLVCCVLCSIVMEWGTNEARIEQRTQPTIHYSPNSWLVVVPFFLFTFFSFLLFLLLCSFVMEARKEPKQKNKKGMEQVNEKKEQTNHFLSFLLSLFLWLISRFLRPSSIVNKPKRKGKKIMKVNSWFVLCSLFVPLL